MKNNLFEFTGKLPQSSGEITIYSTLQTKEQREKNLQRRLQSLPKIFSIKGKAVEQGGKLFISDKTKSLSLYEASDSFWYQDDKFFASENKDLSQKLPNEMIAKEIATKFMSNNKLLLPNASIYSTSFTTVAVNKPRSVKTDEYNTEIHVNFRYTLDSLPIFGPGAKSRVSLVDNKTTSGVYHFWRNTEPVKEKRKLLSPELALEILYKNFRFAQLQQNDSAKVIIQNMEQGYFAMSPRAVQNYLIPVYRVRGTVRTEALPRYNFDHYIVGVKYTDDDVKAMGVSIQGVKAMVF